MKKRFHSSDVYKAPPACKKYAKTKHFGGTSEAIGYFQGNIPKIYDFFSTSLSVTSHITVKNPLY